MPHPVHAHYAEPSLAFSAEDDYSQPSDRLVSLALEAARLSREVGLDELDLRWAQTGPPSERHPYLRPSCWPGEHYRLLAVLLLARRPLDAVADRDAPAPRAAGSTLLRLQYPVAAL